MMHLKRQIVKIAINIMGQAHVAMAKVVRFLDRQNLTIWQEWLTKSLLLDYRLSGVNTMFDHMEWRQTFLNNPGYNDAEDFRVETERLPNAKWRCIGVHHLTGDENRGKHHIFLDVLDKQGERIRNARILVDDGGTEHLPVIDKPDYEPGANYAMWRQSLCEVSIPDGISDEVTGLSTAHISDGIGNSLYHHSFFVVFQEVDPDNPPIPPKPDPDPPTPGTAVWLSGVIEVTINKAAIAKMRPDSQGNVTIKVDING